ncbi:hypothetical protein JQ625_11660 [Bradyrhizobium diazoefficiens]|nr:hypothetical protein [Bradyrhizobium diazoefficiens]MBR0775489.1 hypothetical protein [Bradyrhizobium diazoefficiens]
MLPGLRFLFAAILLSASMLVFGLGATSLLRATHEEYVNNPSWRNGPKEQVFAQAPEPVRPVLAALRAEPEEEAAPWLQDQVPTIGLPLSGPEQVASLAPETSAQPAPEVAPAAETPAAEPANVKTAATEPATAEAAAPATTDTLTPADTTASIPEAAPPASESSEIRRAEMAATLAASALDIMNAKVAALNDPATTALPAPPKAKADSTTSDGKATKRRAKAKKRHRVVRRPPPPPVQQQQLDPFGQPLYAATTARTR